MATRQTFHTPSFGDEEFEILATPSYDHQPIANTELSLLSSTTSSSLHTLPVLTNQSSQWQTEPVVSNSVIGGGDTGIKNIVMEDSKIIAIDENDTGKFTSTILAEDAACKMKKKRDPNEPQKIVSPYALFFRDTQTAIKEQNPSASFIEICKIVASMWDALDPEHKNVYKKKSEIAKKEYLKSLAAYRASKTEEDNEMNIHDNISAIPINSVIDNNCINTATNIQMGPVEMTNNVTSSVVNVLTLSRVPSQDTLQTVPASDQSIAANQTNTSGLQSSQQNNFIPANVTNPNTNILEPVQSQKCIREGCNNVAIISPYWENEYCSNECVIIHCRDVFGRWVQSNNSLPPENYQTA